MKTISPAAKSDEVLSDDRNGRPVEVLLIEDNPGDVILLEEALKEGRMTVNITLREDGLEAIKYLSGEGRDPSSRRPDLIVLDLNMPGADGHQILKIIRQAGDFKHTPVVILTTSNVPKDIKRAYESGATCFITKPFGFYNFMEAVKAIERFWFNVVTLPPNG